MWKFNLKSTVLLTYVAIKISQAVFTMVSHQISLEMKPMVCIGKWQYVFRHTVLSDKNGLSDFRRIKCVVLGTVSTFPAISYAANLLDRY